MIMHCLQIYGLLNVLEIGTVTLTYLVLIVVNDWKIYVHTRRKPCSNYWCLTGILTHLNTI
jgi:hypothetical protein